MNRSIVGLRSALSVLAQPIHRAHCRSGMHPRHTEVGELVLAELQVRRKRMSELLRLLDEEMRRNGDAAFPSGRRAKPVQRSGRPRRAA